MATEISDESILEIARQRFDVAAEAEIEIRKAALDDLQFRAGEQWPDDIKRQRDIDDRPCLTINKLPGTLHQITNDQRQNRPAVQVSPVDDQATIETAKIFKGIIRHIEYSSNADVAYDTGFEGAATKGFGYWRLVTDYCDPLSFNQEIKIKRVLNSFSIYLDPFRQEPDGSDSEWGFAFEEISKEQYDRDYPDSDLASMDDWAALGDNRKGWIAKDTVRIAEYLYKEYKNTTIVMLSNGQVVEKDKLPPQLPEGLSITAERKTRVPVVKWAKINGIEILERTTMPGSGRFIPIIPVLGDELDVDGKRVLEGIVRHAKDPQRMYNYWASAETEMIALAPKAPFIGAAGQFQGFEKQWQSANVKNHPYLEYNIKTLNGQPVGPPQRNGYEPPVQAISNARMLASEDIKATTGIYDASLGAQSNEKSGIAINQRKQQGQLSNFHLVDNLNRAIKHCGRILVDWIPSVYDTQRAQRIIHEDGQEEIVALNQIFQKDGKDQIYDLSVGQYDVTISSGPSYETKRQETVDSMISLSKSYPKIMDVAGDLMVKSMDWQGAKEIADRMHAMLPPQLQNDGKEQQPLPPEVQNQMGQMTQMIQQLTGHLHAAQDQIDQKTKELESKERIEFAKIQAQIEIALVQMGSSDAQALLKHEISSIQHRLDLLHANQPIDTEINAQGAGPTAAQPAAQDPTKQPTGGSTPGQPMGV